VTSLQFFFIRFSMQSIKHLQVFGPGAWAAPYAQAAQQHPQGAQPPMNFPHFFTVRMLVCFEETLKLDV
jgi:hypothetical protein